jgi:hypothetical protein
MLYLIKNLLMNQLYNKNILKKNWKNLSYHYTNKLMKIFKIKNKKWFISLNNLKT